ncbi:M6 family metalloprotease-like protein [Promicromonospora sp. AC04]|uniref:M6 family metalloprotease domain-containing protein n=1 Tax=Promicromonospora sp. AC04 TaxID=2135723 RepID=UPI000D347AA2|nr:M6 family metalloprotease domain-containing protein [Promicromonospora sp. AC04]PUB22174.1 M6 family metalloprotease-like protein [Promicromonospora sp. AC04]
MRLRSGSRPTPAPGATGRAARWTAAVAGVAALAVSITFPLAGATSTEEGTAPASGSPIAAPDPQDWTDQADMTWEDYSPVRPAEWDSAQTSQGSDVQYRTAVILLEFEDQPFLITQDPQSHPFGNPQSGFQPVAPEDVRQWYYDYYATPSEYNGGQTLHGYWMEDSHGKIGVDVEVFGPYELPGKLHEYGYSGSFNAPIEEYCPQGDDCTKDIRTAGFAAWHEDLGGCAEQLCGYDNAFWVTAGHDESSTWEEFGQMMFESPEDVPDALGPPRDENGEPPLNQNGDPMPNWAPTRYVDWTSWRAAANHWPNAGGGTSTQAESSGLSVFAHEFSHLRSLPDNYNNPFADNTRAFTGYWEMMSRGSFNGPGGTHNRWQIPNAGGSALGPHHMLHFKQDLGVLTADDQVLLTRSELAEQGLAVATLKARSSVPDGDKVGLEVTLDGGYTAGQCAADLPEDTDFWCPDGTGWNDFTMEVVDRVGNDSFTAGHGVLLAQNQPQGSPREWIVDANPENINRIDYYRPDGTPVPVVRGDPRQLDDGTFHAGTASGSSYEYVDEPNNLHMYVLDVSRDAEGALTYDVAVRNLDASGTALRGARLGRAQQHPVGDRTTLVNVPLKNTGEAGDGVFGSDVYRISASVQGRGWDVTLPYEVTAVEAGGTLPVSAYATASDGAARSATLTLTVVSESDPTVSKTVRVPLRAKAPTVRSLSDLVDDYQERGVLTRGEARQLEAQLRIAAQAPGGAADAALARFVQDAEGLADVGQRNLAAAALAAAAGELRDTE